MSEESQKLGRPTTFTPELGDEICEMIASGKSLVSVCKEKGIGYRTVMGWLEKDPSFAQKYALAQDSRADYLAEEIMELSDEKPQTTKNRFGTEVVDSGWVSNQKNRVDARKWMAAKLKPKKYGDRVALAGDDESPLKVTTDGKLESRIAELLGKAGIAAAAGGEGSKS